MNSSYSNNFQQVAEKCNEYAPSRHTNTYSNAIGEASTASCLKCDHFEGNHCNLDLYDSIVNRL